VAPLVYGLCALAAATCAVLLFRAYLRVQMRLLLWSSICFVCLTINNVLIAADLVVFPHIDLFIWRNVAALCGVGALLYGLIWEAR
jgi:hypothetical protein